MAFINVSVGPTGYFFNYLFGVKKRFEQATYTVT